MFKTMTTLLFVALGSLVLLGATSLNAGIDSAVQANGPALAQATPAKFAGIFVSDVAFLDFATGEVREFQSMSAFHPDGTFTQSDSNDFDPLDGGGLDGTTYGSWKATDALSTTQTALFYVYDGNGAVLYTARGDWDTQLESVSSGNISGGGEVRIYFAGMDALDKDAGILVGSFTFTGRRLDA